MGGNKGASISRGRSQVGEIREQWAGPVGGEPMTPSGACLWHSMAPLCPSRQSVECGHRFLSSFLLSPFFSYLPLFILSLSLKKIIIIFKKKKRRSLSQQNR